MTGYRPEPGSFRDRRSRLFYLAGMPFRGLSDAALTHWETLSSTAFFRRFMQEGKIVRTERLDFAAIPDAITAGEWNAILRHQTIPFISYPYEWCFGMLKDAALLQLDLLLAALDEEMILKDSTPYNIQWRGTSPIFIDIPSFERFSNGEPWVGYRQFCQMFLYPLFLQAYKGAPFQPWLRGQIDGINPEHMNSLMSSRDLFRSGVFTHVYLHARLQRRYAATMQDVKRNLRSAGFRKDFIRSNAHGLRKLVAGLRWQQKSSLWADYAATASYPEGDLGRKAAFLQEIVRLRHWGLVWDLGCNTGMFSRIAAENADYVIAMDADHLAVERLYEALKSENQTTILPLVINLADPSPGLGWRGLERKSLPERGCPELVLCLALVHHIVIGANIPLREFIEWLASLNSSLVIEFVTRKDERVQQLLRHKADIYHDYNQDYFRESLLSYFDLEGMEKIKGGKRLLYYARPKEPLHV